MSEYLSIRAVFHLLSYRYKNLQREENLVKLDDWKQIWIPDFIMENTEETAHTSTHADEEHSIVQLSMIDESLFTSKYTNNHNDFYYEGSNVMISKSNSYTYHFICHFNWADYPFDQQVLILFLFYLKSYRNCFWITFPCPSKN